MIFASAVVLVIGAALVYFIAFRWRKQRDVAAAAAVVFAVGIAAEAVVAVSVAPPAAPAPVPVAQATPPPQPTATPAPPPVDIPKLTILPFKANGFVDVVDVKPKLVAPLKPLRGTVPLGSIVEISGWIAEPTLRPGDRLIGIVDNKRRIDLEAAYGRPRPDVEKATSNPNLLDVGFVADFVAKELKPGAHTIDFAVAEADKNGMYELHKPVKLVVGH